MPKLSNLVVLGQGAPNQLRDGRQATCICAWSLEKKHFVRIYPVPLGWLRRWDVFDVVVEKNPSDSRESTWKIKNSKEDWKTLGKWIKKRKLKYPKKEQRKLIEAIPKTTINELRENGNSFGLIKPIIKAFELDKRREKTQQQTTLTKFDDDKILDEGNYVIVNQKDYKYKPYVIYECKTNGETESRKNKKPYRQQITEWGCYEFMRKNPGQEEKIKDNLRLFDDDWEKYFLVGNIHKSTKTYIIIDVIRFKKKPNKK